MHASSNTFYQQYKLIQMNAGQRALFLLKLAKALRTFAIGISIIIFIENLFMKDIFRQTPFLIQISAFIGTSFMCYILKAYQRKLGIKNYALAGALVMTITATGFAQLWSPTLLVPVAIFGIMPALGQQISLFTNIQEAFIAKQSSKQPKSKRQQLQTKDKAIDRHRLIGSISKPLGSLFCAIFYYNQFRSAQLDEKSHVYLMRIYTMLCGLHFLAYLCVDSKELQSIEESENWISQSDPNKKVKTGIIAAATFFVFFGLSFMNLTNLSFFVHQKYELEFQTVAALTAAAIIINFIAKLLASKLVINGCVLSSLILSCFSSLLLSYIAVTTRLLSAQLAILALALLGNKLKLVILQKIRSEGAASGKFQQNKSLFEGCKNVAIVCSMILYCIFQINTERQKLPFSYPILISAYSQLFSALVLFLCIWCLGSNSSNAFKEDFWNGLRSEENDRANELQQGQRMHFGASH